MLTPESTGSVAPVIVITVELPALIPPREALTNIPTVPAVLPAVNLTDAPVPAREPSEPAESAHWYEIPDDGQAPPLHDGVAVKVLVPAGERVGVVGLMDNEARVIADEVTVINACVPWVVPLSVAFTKRPADPAVLPAVKLIATPVGTLIDPIVLLVRAHVYEIPDTGHLEVHAGVAAKS
jgi:hypothetical protein